jgi:hypothetical protein
MSLFLEINKQCLNLFSGKQNSKNVFKTLKLKTNKDVWPTVILQWKPLFKYYNTACNTHCSVYQYLFLNCHQTHNIYILCVRIYS